MNKGNKQVKDSQGQSVKIADSPMDSSSVQVAQATDSNTTNIQGDGNHVQQYLSIFNIYLDSFHSLNFSPIRELKKQDIAFVIVASLITTLGILIPLRSSGYLRFGELPLFDQMLRQQTISSNADGRILVVNATSEEVDSLREKSRQDGHWQEESKAFSDYTLNKLFHKLNTHQAKVIGLFPRHSSSFNKEYKHIWSNIEADKLVAICEFDDKDNGVRATKAPPDLSNQTVGFGDMTAELGNQTKLRRLILSMQDVDPTICRGDRADAFSLQLVTKFLESDKRKKRAPSSSDNITIQFGEFQFPSFEAKSGGYQMEPSDFGHEFQIVLNYPPYKDYLQDIVSSISITDVLEGKVSEDQVRGRIVLVGTNSPDFSKKYETPFSKDLPALFVHAAATRAILETVEGKRSLIYALPNWIDTILIFAVTLAGGGLALYARFLRSPLTLIANLSGCVFLILILFYSTSEVLLKDGAWLPLFPSCAGFLILNLTTFSFSLVLNTQNNSFAKNS
jgi:CHASE2 domain-containing sensor protein